MPQFEYVVLDPEGRRKRGVIEAADRPTLIDSLQRQGNIAIHADPVRIKRIGWLRNLRFLEQRGTTLTRSEIVDFTRELATMLAAGQDLDRGLRFLVETAPNKRAAHLIGDLKERLRSGASLSVGLAAHPKSFSQLYAGLVKAGEAGGTLSETLVRLANMLEQERKLNSTIATAMIYPLVLLVVAGLVITLLLTIVLPQFEPLFTQNGVKVPAETQFLILISSFLRDCWIACFGIIAVVILLVMRASRLSQIRLMIDDWKLKAPVIGVLGRESLAARFTRTLGTLMGNGLPLMQALAITKDATANTRASNAIAAAADTAKAGGSLARALEASRLFPARTIHLLLLGEETGQLAAISLRAADIHEEKVRLYVQTACGPSCARNHACNGSHRCRDSRIAADGDAQSERPCGLTICGAVMGSRSLRS